MKKVIALLLVVGMLLCFTACGGAKGKAEKLLKEYENKVEDYIEAIEDGDMDKAEKINKEITEITNNLADALEELVEEDPDAAEELTKEMAEVTQRLGSKILSDTIGDMKDAGLGDFF